MHALAVLRLVSLILHFTSNAEFWMRYVLWLEANSSDTALSALQRATLVYCKRKPEMHVFSARYYERHGNMDEARATYRRVLSEISPGLLEVTRL